MTKTFPSSNRPAARDARVSPVPADVVEEIRDRLAAGSRLRVSDVANIVLVRPDVVPAGVSPARVAWAWVADLEAAGVVEEVPAGSDPSARLRAPQNG